ncbi:MAG: sulfate transport system permease protein, partial [Methylococcaceae bacterium NSM2-1]
MPQSNIMPGFRPAIGLTLVYLALIVLIPLSAMLLKSMQLSLDEYWAILSNRRVQDSFSVSFGAALIAAAVAAVFGFIIAWTLVRYTFPGKRLVDALIDLPFALPTAVAGIVLATIYEPQGWIGKLLMDNFGVQIAYTPKGIVVALIFIGLPFVVRTIEPVLQELDTATEEAAASLG